ncbi:hypothetical protein QZH41_015477 [Actinostola sp. cb2023]|nr:hypothetical protein QZH41_015477 [Actinostola sp. cb2023]
MISFVSRNKLIMTLSMDEMLHRIGSLGIYQTRLLLILSWVLLFNIGYPYLLLTFLIYEPPWKCVANSTVCTVTGDIKPGDANYNFRCDILREEWEFTGERTSVITEFELICNKVSLSILSPTLFFIGTLVSDCFCGILSDKIGRKPVMLIFGFLVSVFSVSAALSHSHWLYTFCRFFVGLSYSATFIPMYTLSMEFVGVDRHHISGTIIWFSWAFTVMLLAGIAYLFNDWRAVTLAGAVPGFLILICWWFIPESIRFLLLKDKTAEAEKTLRKIAKINGREYPNEPLNNFVFNKEQRQGSILDLVRTKKMLHITVSLFFISLTATVVYLAVTITSPSLGGNMYLNVFLFGLVEIPANVVGMITIKRFGRRNVISVSMIVAAAGAFLVILLTIHDPGNHKGYTIGRISTSLLAKMAVVISYITVVMFTAECYPSIIRSTGLAVSNNAGVDIGGIISPLVIKLDHFHPLLPYSIIGGSALLAGILCLTLKETGHKPTMETFNDEAWIEKPCLNDQNGEEYSNQNRETDV